MKRRTVAGAVAGIAAVLLISGGCGASTTGHDMGSMPSMASPSATPSSGAASTSGAHNDADVMFVAMMIPHHQQAVQMSDILLAKTGVDQPVRELATAIKQAQAPEIATMQGWLTAWGNSSPGMAMDHGDMGMMSEADLATFTKADGPTGQRLFLAGMIKHHQGAVAMAEQIISSGQSSDVRSLAQSIITSQQAEITQMQKLQAS